MRCGKCNTRLDKGNKVNWNPEKYLCDSCQHEWTELFFRMGLDKRLSSYEGIRTVNKVWQEFIRFNPSDFNPSYRYIFKR